MARDVMSVKNASMFPFKTIADDAPALAHSPLLRAVLLTISYMEENGPIGLTPSKALKRYFVEWAAENFDWPHYTAEDLYAVNKVLGEQDFPPLITVHDLLLNTKLARHYRGTLRLTAQARDLKMFPGKLWRLLASQLLFFTDHSLYTRFGEPFAGDWFIYVNAINLEAEAGVSRERLGSLFYGIEEARLRGEGYDKLIALYAHVLRPLAWSGLLSEHVIGRGFERSEVFFKTPLWAAAFSLPTDEVLRVPTRH